MGTGERIANIAHRGASASFPENTIAAFTGACDAGAVMCELDVQLTRDGHLVVIHDETVDRTTDGNGDVAAMSLAELKRLDAGAKFVAASRARAGIPTLDEVFAATAGRCDLNIELKGAGTEARVAAAMGKWNALGTSMVSSFEWKRLRAIRKLEPSIRIGVLTEDEPDAMLDEATAVGAFAVNPRFDLATPELCSRAHHAGMRVLVWTVDVPELMRLMIGHGVDGIMTNHPERLAAVIAEMK
jgi:glycerophosphoryl diester phosphodiesterase